MNHLQHVDCPKKQDRKRTRQRFHDQCFSHQRLICWSFTFEVFHKKDTSNGRKQEKHLAVIHHLQHIDDPKNQGRKRTKQRPHHFQRRIYQKRMFSKTITQ
ncbi:hypothetical protein TNCT_118811 [Trichonephila clavata]|uniref:Uncharacterized protein n=1 Tax=Trichonephila clavata TaxID=2740835 RepID=A0A8X6F2X9_TRICU|nr:hypothetical protein TNCT_118811 [Trichonephila clavata]